VNAEELVWKYLVDHKTPVMAITLAKRFLISESHIRRILKVYSEKQVLDVVMVGTRKYYKIKE
jgi:hypothetical protein